MLGRVLEVNVRDRRKGKGCTGGEYMTDGGEHGCVGVVVVVGVSCGGRKDNF